MGSIDVVTSRTGVGEILVELRAYAKRERQAILVYLRTCKEQIIVLRIDIIPLLRPE